MTTICKLPPELLLKVLIELPARDVQRSRAICAYFRELVNGNINHLCHELYAREHDRLTACIDYHFKFGANVVSFPESLRRGLSRRTPIATRDGPHVKSQCLHTAYAVQATRQYCHKFGVNPAAYITLVPVLDRDLGFLAWEMMKLCYSVHHTDQKLDAPKYTTRHRFVESMSAGHMGLVEIVGAGILDLAACWDAAVDPEHSIFPADLADFDDLLSELSVIMPVTMLDLHRVFGVDVRTVTGSDARHQEILERVRVSHAGLCTSEQLSSAVGAPFLSLGLLSADTLKDQDVSPNQARAALHISARMDQVAATYCVRSRWAYRAVQRALEGGSTNLMRAAIMQELFIY